MDFMCLAKTNASTNLTLPNLGKVERRHQENASHYWRKSYGFELDSVFQHGMELGDYFGATMKS